MGGKLKIFPAMPISHWQGPLLTMLVLSLVHVILKSSVMKILKSVSKRACAGRMFLLFSPPAPVNEGIMELLIMIDAVRHASAGRITAVIPYFPMPVQTKRMNPESRLPQGLSLIFLETAGANRVMTMNLHSPQIQGFFRVPVDHLLAGRLLCNHYAKLSTENCVVVAPDAGSAKRAGHYAIRLGRSPLAILDKRRSDDFESRQFIMSSVM